MDIHTFSFEGENSQEAEKKLLQEVMQFIALHRDVFWINYQTEIRDKKYVAVAKIDYNKKTGQKK